MLWGSITHQACRVALTAMSSRALLRVCHHSSGRGAEEFRDSDCTFSVCSFSWRTHYNPDTGFQWLYGDVISHERPVTVPPVL